MIGIISVDVVDHQPVEQRLVPLLQRRSGRCTSRCRSACARKLASVLLELLLQGEHPRRQQAAQVEASRSSSVNAVPLLRAGSSRSIAMRGHGATWMPLRKCRFSRPGWTWTQEVSDSRYLSEVSADAIPDARSAFRERHQVRRSCVGPYQMVARKLRSAFAASRATAGQIHELTTRTTPAHRGLVRELW